MTNEQTQAEKLANEVWKQLTDNSLIRWYGELCDAEIKIAETITQATAELREENERLKAKLDACETAGFDTNDPHSHGRAISKDRDAYIKRVTELETERDQALAKIERLTAIGAPFPPTVERLEAQVASLKAVLQSKCDVDYHASDAIAESGQWEALKEYCRLHNEALDVLGNTQATADAYTAKVRREAIEECIGAVENRINRLKHVESDRMMVIAAESALKNAKAELNNLLPESEAAEKGGA